MKALHQEVNQDFAAYNIDCVELAQSLPDESTHYHIFSPPFATLYTYSSSDRDMGNAKNYEEFFQQYEYLVKEQFRILKTGRLISVHCMQIPLMKERDGVIGIRDFRGDLIRIYQKYGFVLHSEVTIWKDPLVEATRTKAHGLMHKQLCKDSTMCRQGLPDYLITFRKPGENDEPVEKPNGFQSHIGEKEIPIKNTDDIRYSHNVWRNYASPVWMDIRQTRTLQYREARTDQDEKHICPLQLDVIERGIELWTNKGDRVFSPFMGIGSEGYVSLQKDRKFIGSELKTSYYNLAIKNLKNAKEEKQDKGLFD